MARSRSELIIFIHVLKVVSYFMVDCILKLGEPWARPPRESDFVCR